MSTASIPVITIDGPSGVGKGTVCMRLATELGWHVLDSGAIYRALAMAALTRECPLDDETRLAELAQSLDLSFTPDPERDALRVWLDGEDASHTIRTETAGNAASQVAALPAVRAALLARQRQFQQPPGLIADGRDMGTVVFPHAPCKIFLTASPEERARRRLNQLKEKGINAIFADLVDELRERDRRDRERATAPLVAAEDACVIDTSELSIQQVVDQVRARLPPN